MSILTIPQQVHKTLVASLYGHTFGRLIFALTRAPEIEGSWQPPRPSCQYLVTCIMCCTSRARFSMMATIYNDRCPWGAVAGVSEKPDARVFLAADDSGPVAGSISSCSYLGVENGSRFMLVKLLILRRIKCNTDFQTTCDLCELSNLSVVLIADPPSNCKILLT